MRFNTFTLAFFLLMTGWSMPTVLTAQKYSNEFMSIGVSAKAQAMGNAVIATVNDVTAGYWNPAGLTHLEKESGLQLGAMHAEWFAGVGKFDYLAMTLPLAAKNRRIGFSIVRFGIDDIPNTLSLYESDGSINYDNIVSFSAADYAFLGSFAQVINLKSKPLRVGGNVKVIRRVIGKFANSWGFGVDLGAQYAVNDWKFGLQLQDITNTFNAWRVNFTEKEKDVLVATGNDLPDIKSLELTKPQIILGVAKSFSIKEVLLTTELDFRATTDGKRNTLISGNPISIDPAFGLEVGYKHFVFLRAGVNQFQYESSFEKDKYLTLRPAIGVGMRIKSFTIDYALTDPGDSKKTFSHIISLTLDLKPKH